MKKILLGITAVASAMFAWWCGITLHDLIDALWYCVDIVNAVGSAFMDYIFPRQEGIRSYIVSGYLGARSFFGRFLGWQPLSIYDHILDRAKANPLEAFGAVAIIMLCAWLIVMQYRMLYRFYHWLLITRRKR
jgi:hypothetical protein